MSDSENELAKLRSRISKLESQLEYYFDWLEGSIEQRDRFLLGSSWGIVKATSAIFGFIAFNYVLNNWLGLEGWIWSVVGGIGGLAAYMAAYAWQEGGEEKDAKKLNRLPKWEDREER